MGWFFTSKPRRRRPKYSSMAPPPPSLSSLLPHSQPSFIPPQNPHLTQRYMPSPRPFHSLSFTTRFSPDNKLNNDKITYPPPPPPPQQEKKSFAIATGELFLGIASRVLRSRNKNRYNNDKVSGLSLLEKSDDGIVDYEERIRAVMEDEVEPVVIWEQRVKDIEAEKERPVVTSPGFCFSAAGLLFPYHLGVAHLLIEKGYIKETTPLAGSSAGAIVCAVIASGVGMQEALTATKVLAEDCRLRGTAFRLGAVLRDILEKFLPDDVHVRCNGRVRVAVTQILWRPRGLLVDQFDSKEDLINAVVTSSFIPGYLAPRPATMFRNRLCIDGGLTLFMPPTSAAQTVRVCAFSASGLGLQGIGISPDCNPENRATPRELFNWALEPAEDHILDRLFELGYLDAAVWAEENPVQNVVQDDSPLVENGSSSSQ
uniref:Patatin n=1 Tax=Populus davidiana TaxID=266767 RepID=A0A6M2EZW1_9ROSI